MINEESLKIWEQEHIELLTSREMGEWLHRRDMNARRQGEWIETRWHDEVWRLSKECPFCHEQILSTHYNFCGNCRANMRVKNE